MRGQIHHCSMEGCDTRCHGQGLCLKHYRRWKRTGSPLVVRSSAGSRPGSRRPLAERMWAKVEKSGPDDCWLWTGSLDPHGYGRLLASPDSPVQVRAHRVAFEETHGPIAEGLVIDHLCHTGDCVGACEHRRCCNPAHLRQTTIAGNVLRSLRERQASEETCGAGHLWAETAFYTPQGHRRCRECERAWNRLSHARARLRRVPSDPVPTDPVDGGGVA